MKKLSDYYRTLGKKDDLIGLRVFDTVNERFVYIKEVEGGLWCGKNMDDEFGSFYGMDRLEIEA